MKKCNHSNLKCRSRCGKELGWFCEKCQKHFKRQATKEETKLINKSDGEHFGKNSVHRISHEFQRKFQDTKELPWGWKWKGYDLMKRVRKWAENHPSVQIVRCDDDHFCGSDLVIIPHESDYHYMGTSVVFIPQCTGENPTKFFLYPHHRLNLGDALVAIKKLENKKRKKSTNWSDIKYGSK